MKENFNTTGWGNLPVTGVASGEIEVDQRTRTGDTKPFPEWAVWLGIILGILAVAAFLWWLKKNIRLDPAPTPSPLLPSTGLE